VNFPERVSRAYRKMHTPLQQPCVFSGGTNRGASVSAPDSDREGP
jgi:hypothetical protein